MGIGHGALGMGHWELGIGHNKLDLLFTHSTLASYPLTALIRGIDKALFSDEIGLR
jgi:hypothetical protein